MFIFIYKCVFHIHRKKSECNKLDSISKWMSFFRDKKWCGRRRKKLALFSLYPFI